MNNEVKRYVHDVLKLLKCSPGARKKSRDNLLFALEDKQLFEPSATYEMCVSQCGTPESVAEEYRSGFTKKELRRITKFHVVLFIIAASVLTAILVAVYIDMSSERPGVLKETGTYHESSEEA